MPTNRKPARPAKKDAFEPEEWEGESEEEEEVEEEEESRRRPEKKFPTSGRIEHKRLPPKQKPKPYANKNGHIVTPWNDVTISGFTKYVQGIAITENGIAYLNFQVNVSQGKGKTPAYLKVTMWGDIAEKAEKDIVDGIRVVVKGRLTQKKYQDKLYTGIRGDYYELIEEEE